MPQMTINENVYMVENGVLLKEVLGRFGVVFPCGGNGVCGKCKVRISGDINPITEAEKRLLTDADIAGGIRLACFTRVLGDCRMALLPVDTPQILSVTDDAKKVDGRFSYGVAVDIGTTTVAAVMYDGNGRNLATASMANPQIVYGADVLSRAQAASMGKGAELSMSICRCIDDLLHQLCAHSGTKVESIQKVVVTGNTAMLCMLSEMSVTGLLRAPFHSSCLFGEFMALPHKSFSALSQDSRVYLPRCMDAFLGADFVCAMQAVNLTAAKDTVLLVDIGTNGEMALWHNSRLFACSTAAGPAFEGVGISCGMVAAPGAIDSVKVVNHSLLVHAIDDGKPRGICGSGLIDAVACLLDLDELDKHGVLTEEKYPLSEYVWLSREDVQALLVSKSAICSGLESLCHAAGVLPDDVTRVYVAGGFGSSLNLHNAVRIGLFPEVWEGRILPVGNAALEGAAQILFGQNDDLPPFNRIELATDAFFAEFFIRNMHF